jgi:predicted ATPase
LPQEITDQITDRTDGVPLFIEELTKAVLESGLLVASGDQPAATDPVYAAGDSEIAPSVALARLDRLALAREVAQIAAALGRQFSHELISAAAAMPRQQLDDALTQLGPARMGAAAGHLAGTPRSPPRSRARSIQLSFLLLFRVNRVPIILVSF